MEERLATRLLQRTTRSVSLTEDGAVFYERMRSASCRRPKSRSLRSIRGGKPTRAAAAGSAGLVGGGCISCRFCGSFGAVAGGGRRRQLLRRLQQSGARRHRRGCPRRRQRRQPAGAANARATSPDHLRGADYLARHIRLQNRRRWAITRRAGLQPSRLPAPARCWSTANCEQPVRGGCVSSCASRPCRMRPSPGRTGLYQVGAFLVGEQIAAGTLVRRCWSASPPGAADLRRLSQPAPSPPR
ncbi:hypothetical protein M8494_24675 [Serratia ureilytica]